MKTAIGLAGGLVLVLALGGCVSVAEFRKLEYEVNKMKTRGVPGGADSGRVADLVTEIEELRQEVSRLDGRLEVAEHRASSALEEAQAARREAAGAPGPAAAAPLGPSGTPIAPGTAPPAASASAELLAYREAYNAWRIDDHGVCIDRFRQFLQTYASSDYADDAAYWMADCYFKQGDYQTAILRFDDVAGRYPTSEKAAEALYRQGEALLRLGPRYAKAAEKAFERVIAEYPGSVRAVEAQRQLEILGAG